MIPCLKSAIVLSAKGADTFTERQQQQLQAAGAITFHTCLEPLSDQQLVELLQGYPVVALTRRATRRLTGEILHQLRSLKGLAIYTTGYEWIDLEAINRLGITLSYLPDYCTIAVAEHSVGMVLTLAHKLHLARDRATQKIDQGISLRGMELYGKTVGIVGFGNIGRYFSRLIHPFGVTCYHHDPTPDQTAGVPHLPKQELYKQSDIIVVLASQSHDETPIITEQEINWMKPGTLLVNPSRKSLVDSCAVKKGIDRGIIAAYGVDDQLPEMRACCEPGRIFETAQTAWYTTEAIHRGTACWVENIVAMLRGEPKHTIT